MISYSKQQNSGDGYAMVIIATRDTLNQTNKSYKHYRLTSGELLSNDRERLASSVASHDCEASFSRIEVEGA